TASRQSATARPPVCRASRSRRSGSGSHTATISWAAAAAARFEPIRPQPMIANRIQRSSRIRPRSCPLHHPAILREPVYRAHDPFPDRELRPPAESANPGRVKEDEAVVTNPSLRAAGIAQLRLQPEMARDPADG